MLRNVWFHRVTFTASCHRPRSLTRPRKPHASNPSNLNASSNKGRSSRSVLLVVPVGSCNDDAVVADVVAFVTNDEDLGRRNTAEALITVCITECYNYVKLAEAFLCLAVGLLYTYLH